MASGFRMTAGTPSGRYGLPSGNRDRLRPTHPPPAGASLRAGVVSCLPCGGAGDLCRAQRPRHIAALCRESGTTRRRVDRTKSPSLFHNGTAVTAGAGPQTVRKDASRRFLPPTYRRPAPGPPQKRSFCGERKNEWNGADIPPGGWSGMEFVLTRSQGPFLFPQKKKWFLPPEGFRPCGGEPHPGGTPPPARWDLARPGRPLAAPTQGDGAPGSPRPTTKSSRRGERNKHDVSAFGTVGGGALSGHHRHL